MAAAFKCEERVDGRPLRIVDGFPCHRPAKYVVVRENFSERKVCGVHKNNLVTHYGWQVVSELTTPAP